MNNQILYESELLDTFNALERPEFKTEAEREAYMLCFKDVLKIFGMKWVDEAKVELSNQTAPPAKRIKASEVTIANQAAYTRQAANDFAKLWKPYEATIKLLKEYHKVKPKETEAAIVTIGDAVEAKMRELEKLQE